MLALAIALAAAPPLEGCDHRDHVALDTKLAADLSTTYDVDGTKLRVCVESAWYPYKPGRGHELWTCFRVALGKDTKRFCSIGGDDTFADWKGYRIAVWLRTPRYTEPCDVWLDVTKSR
jgi:hypothetical protein